MKNIGGIIGYSIGAVFFLPMLLLLLNKFYINKNDAKKVIKLYQNNYKELSIIFPDRYKNKYDTRPSHHSQSYTISFATANMGRDASSRIRKNFRVIYSDKYQKYFAITMFDDDGGCWFAINNKVVLMRINIDELNNPSYGTLQNPVPVFSIRGANDPLLSLNISGHSVNYDTSQEQYDYNVYMYLRYVMPKEEFLKRYPK